jgi:hypothetical protein
MAITAEDCGVFRVEPARRQPLDAFGGADRDRTDDPLLAKQVLSQLSYSPTRQREQADRRPAGGEGVGNPRRG